MDRNLSDNIILYAVYGILLISMTLELLVLGIFTVCFRELVVKKKKEDD